MKTTHNNLKELVETLSPYMSASALGRICGINEGQMRQYVSEVRNPSPRTIAKINEGLRKFGEELRDVRIE